MPKEHERRKPVSIAPPAVEWERVREAAHRAGQPVSAYVRHCVFADAPGSPTGAPAPGPRVAGTPSEDDWRALLVRVERVCERLSATGPAAAPPELTRLARLVLQDKLAEMQRQGRAREARNLLRRVAGTERAIGR